MNNAKLTYLYRDGGNYKQWAEVIFSNGDELPIDVATESIRNALTPDGFFIADQTRLPGYFSQTSIRSQPTITASTNFIFWPLRMSVPPTATGVRSGSSSAKCARRRETDGVHLTSAAAPLRASRISLSRADGTRAGWLYELSLTSAHLGLGQKQLVADCDSF
jgi:hypothetical protein